MKNMTSISEIPCCLNQIFDMKKILMLNSVWEMHKHGHFKFTQKEIFLWILLQLFRLPHPL